MAARIRLRRGTLAEIAASDMASGELCFATDSKQVIASDGTTKFHVSGSSSGLREDRPSASLAGRLFVATDTHESWLDTGTSWLPLVEFGITEGTVCEGDDARLDDARSPTSHTHEEADITDLGTYLELVDGKAPTATLGSGTADNSVFLRGDQTWASPAEIAVPDASMLVKGKIQLAGDLGGTAAAPTVVDATTSAKGKIQLAGDLGGTAASPTVVDATAAVKGKIQLAGDLGGTAASPTVVDATAAVKGKIQLAGDLGGTAASPTVVGIHSGVTGLAISTITDGEYLKRDGNNITSGAVTTTTYPTAWYYADISFAAKTVSAAADRYKLLTPNVVQSDVGGVSLTAAAQATLDLSLEATWDTISGTDYRTASNRAGKDFYVYLCQPVSGTAPVIKVSANSTYPSGYNASTSRKVGGFPCLSVAVGTISGHPGSGYVAGDIIPNGVWDLKHYSASYPKNGNVGMAYIDRLDEWQFIYLQSNTGTSSASVYGATITDTRMWNDHVDDAGAVGCFLPTDSSFQIAAEGSNQQTNIAGSADPVTTGGHSDTASRRMISNYFLEDCCGAMWQWLQDQSHQVGTGVAGWKDVVGGTKGQLYLTADDADVKLIAGGGWDGAASCGSRSRAAIRYRWFADAFLGARFAARAIHK